MNHKHPAISNNLFHLASRRCCPELHPQTHGFGYHPQCTVICLDNIARAKHISLRPLELPNSHQNRKIQLVIKSGNCFPNTHF